MVFLGTMKSKEKENREILHKIEMKLLERPLNDREKSQKLIMERHQQRLDQMHNIKLALMRSEHLDRMRLIQSGINIYT
jgi:hypothetical protein